MTVDDFRSALELRGGHADLWLVAVVDIDLTFSADDVSAQLERAFWTRGEAYAFAHLRHAQNARHHCYVFTLAADVGWTSTDSPRIAELETVVTAAGDGRRISITPAQVAAVIER